MLTSKELENLLTQFRTLSVETEIVEFKEAKTSYDLNKLGKYFSALCNEANLQGSGSAWLIFGIRDKDKAIVGSQYRPNRADLDSLKAEIANKTTNRITFIDIHELTLSEGRVVMFEIPAAPRGIPIAWEGHYYGRDGEELQPLNLEEIERIRVLNMEDWSAVICPDATIDDLDSKAIAVARRNYTNKIRKLTYRYMKEGTLFPQELPQYEQFTIREAINNCIAHQDYSIGGGRINVVEYETDQLVFSNIGTFIPKSVEEVVIKDAPALKYRNPFLAHAMFNLDMVDTMGGGIRKMFMRKRKLIEGRKPNFFIAKSVAQQVEKKADYTKNKAFDKKYYLDLIVKFIEQHGQMERKEADSLLFNKLPEWMSQEQKRAKVGNLLSELRQNKIIRNQGVDIKPIWVLEE